LGKILNLLTFLHQQANKGVSRQKKLLLTKEKVLYII